MHVDLLSTFFPNRIERDRGVFLYQFAVALLETGCSVRVISPVPFFPSILAKTDIFGWWSGHGLVPKEERIGPFDVCHPRYVVLPKVEFLSGWTYGGALSKELFDRGDRDRILSVHCGYPDGVGGALYAARTGRKFTLTLHGTDMNISFRKRFIKPQMKFAFQNASALVAVSEELRGKLPRTLRDRCRVIPCAAYDPGVFQIIDRSLARRSLGLEEKGNIILFVGELRHVKGADRISDMAERLRTDETLCVVGDGELGGKLREHVQSAAIGDRVRFFGKVPHARIPAWMNAADVLWMPSRSEGMPNVLIESLRCGTPVVATRVGGIPGVLKEGQNGYLTEVDDLDQMRAGLTNVMSRNFDRADLSDSVEMYTWKAIAKMYSSLFQEMVG